MDIATLIIQLISGAAGGNLGGALLKNLSLGTLGNSLAGLIGGGIGSQVLNSMLGPAASVAATAAGGDIDVGAILQQVAGGGIGGSAMMMIVGILKQMFSRN
jgi:hypothetical protein